MAGANEVSHENLDNGMSQVPNLDLINELKLKSGVPISQLKEDQIKRNKELHSTEEIEPVDPNDFTMEKFLDKVPEVTKDGQPIPPWKRQMMARKEAERAKKVEEERHKQEAEERRIAKIPPWRLQMLGIKPPVNRQTSSPSHSMIVAEPEVKKRSYSLDKAEVNGHVDTTSNHQNNENLEEETTLAPAKKNSIPQSLLGVFMVQSLAKKKTTKSVSDEEEEDTVSTLSETHSERQEQDVAVTPAKKPPGRLPRSPLATLLVESLGHRQQYGDPEESSTVEVKKLPKAQIADESQLQNVPKSLGQKSTQLGDAATEVTKTANDVIQTDSNLYSASHFNEDLHGRQGDDDDYDDEYDLNPPPIIIEEKVGSKVPDAGSSTKTVLVKPDVPKEKVEANADDKPELVSSKKITDMISSFKSLEAKQQQSEVKALYPTQTQYSVRPKQAQVLDMHGNPIGSWKDALTTMKR